MRSSVFPEPAGACTMKERATSSARSRCAWSGATKASVIGVAILVARRRPEGRLLGYAAQRMLLAGGACLGEALGIDPRIARRKGAPELVEVRAPAGHQPLPTSVL